MDGKPGLDTLIWHKIFFSDSTLASAAREGVRSMCLWTIASYPDLVHSHSQPHTYPQLKNLEVRPR